MKNRNKILLWVESNFDALMLEREIATHLPKSTIIISGSYEMTERLLRASKFNILVVDLVEPVESFQKKLKSIVEIDKEMKIISLIQNEPELIDFVKENKVISDFLVKRDGFYPEISLAIENLLKTNKSKSVKTKKRTANRSDFDLIKITTGTLQHEINNPLMTILGMCELILDDEDQYDKVLLEKINIIYQSSQRILEVTDKINKISNPSYRKTYNGRLLDLDKSLK